VATPTIWEAWVILTAQQAADRARFAAFVDAHLSPGANRWDREQALPEAVIRALAKEGWLVATLPVEAGGGGLDPLTYGLLSEQIGRGCGSVRNLIAVQGMVAHAIQRWGTSAQADRWVRRVATGSTLAAFALTEPTSGSDARHCATTATRGDGGFLLDGEKAWISFAGRADLFLVFARLDGDLAAFVVERDAPGLRITPQHDLLGLRASHLALLSLERCEVPGENLLCHGRLTFDLVATNALDYGRYSTAWGCVGLAQACLEASLDRARDRVQFGTPIGEHPLIRRLLARMVASVAAARLLSAEAGVARGDGEPDAVRQTLIAKYFASTTAFEVAADAVQVHGAHGCGPDSVVQRHLRDAKIQEIIEGTSQILELQIADLALRQRA
jgi:hypothetical protein